MYYRLSLIKAFTLVELVLVIALLGVMAISLDLFSPSVPMARLESASRQIQSDLEFAKQNAMSTSQTSGVSFTSGGSYTAYQGTTATPLKNPLTQQNLVVSLASSFPGISLSANFVVEFDKMGKPTTGGGGTISITNGSATKTILVTANTGQIIIQ